MIATYKTNADVLDRNMIDSIKSAFPGKDIRIIVSEIPKNDILSNDELVRRIYEVNNDINVVKFNQEEFDKFVEDLSINA
ncbi:MAG: hypothetical protein V1779_13650 [bacterium]